MHVQWGWGSGFGIYELLVVVAMITFWALVIALLILGIRWLLRQERPAGPGTARDDPLEILRERYARGEIDDEEYERRRMKLGGGRSG